VHGYLDHEVLGDRAHRLVANVADTSRADEFDQELAPVLDRVRPEAVALITEAARLARVVTPPLPVQPPVPPPVLPPVLPPVPPKTDPPVTRAGTATEIRGALRDLDAFLSEHPKARFELTWRVVDEPGGES
jgi:hypothetical protein